MKRRAALKHLSMLSASVPFFKPVHLFAEKLLIPARSPKTALVMDPRYHHYTLKKNHPESPQRLIELEKQIQSIPSFKRLNRIFPRIIDREILRLIHTDAHIDAIGKNEEYCTAALLSAGGAISAIDAIMNGSSDNAFCAIRPPGHHAFNGNKAEGFCFFNNAAIAAKYAQRQYGIKKVLIIDWDYHHGNGTEKAFYDDPSVFVISTHNRFAYPGTGVESRVGEGAGHGFNMNIHLRKGTTDSEMLAAWNNKIIPAAHNFKPDFIVISAGFDSRENDLLGTFKLTDVCFLKMTLAVMKIAETYSKNRIVSILEGGYNPRGLALAGAIHVETLQGLYHDKVD